MNTYDGPGGPNQTPLHRDPDASTEATPPGPDAAIPAGGVLRPPRYQVHPKARHAWRISAVLGWLFLLVPLVVVAVVVEVSRPWTAWAAGAVAGVTAVHATVMPEWRYRVHRWEVDDMAVYTRAGWISQTSRVAPVSRIQTVDSSYGPIQRMFGLGRLTVTTASAAGALTVDGLEHTRVEELVARLTAVTARDGGDAT